MLLYPAEMITSITLTLSIIQLENKVDPDCDHDACALSPPGDEREYCCAVPRGPARGKRSRDYELDIGGSQESCKSHVIAPNPSRNASLDHPTKYRTTGHGKVCADRMLRSQEWRCLDHCPACVCI